MSKLDEPPRLFDAKSDTTEGVRGVLRAGKQGLPDADALARLAARLPLGPLPPPSAPLPKAPPLRLVAPIAAPSVLPGVIVGALLGLVVAGGMAWRDAVSTPAAPFMATSPAPIESTPRAAPIPAPSLADPRTDRLDSPRTFATSSASLPRAIAPAEAVRADAPSPAASAAPSSDAPAVVDSETEVHLLQRAQAALGADPSTALALTVDHARRFPGGALGQERELMAVTALVALGRKPEAEARAARLLERFPASAYRARLESLGLGKSFQKNDPGSPRTE